MNPTAFLSYAREGDDHFNWVLALGTRLRSDGINVLLDHWDVPPGGDLVSFMEQSVVRASYVLLVCTPTYKSKSDGRVGGVGYEGSIITGAIFTGTPQTKFIPLLRRGTWNDAGPARMLGARYLDFLQDPYQESQYIELRDTCRGQRQSRPSIGKWTAGFSVGNAPLNTPSIDQGIGGFLPASAAMPLSLGSATRPVNWKLQATPLIPVEATKTELYSALERSVLTTIEDYGRQARWPFAMRFPSQSFDDGWVRWIGVEREVMNLIREEQIALGPSGELIFQSATLWDSEQHFVNVSQLSNDVLIFLRLLGRFRAELGRAGEVEVKSEFETPTRDAVAFFHPGGPRPEDFMRLARFRSTRCSRSRKISPVDLNHGTDALITEAKRMIDGIANEFELDKSPLVTSAKNFMAIDLSSLRSIADRLFDRR